MSTNTKIEWTQATWNPIRGCSRVSEGCRNCYAERQAARFSGEGGAYEGLVGITKVGDRREPRWTGKVVFDAKRVLEPLHWRPPRRVFVNSMSDLFHEGVSREDILTIFAVMRVCPHHTFQVLTKRPKRMLEFLADPRTANEVRYISQSFRRYKRPHSYDNAPWPLQNVWLGVSVEDQGTADERIPLLLQTPAAIRWVSYEPALGYVRFPGLKPAALGDSEIFSDRMAKGDRGGLHWVVVGGESGPGARPTSLRWLINAVDQCKQAGVPVFVKQLGARPGIPSCADMDCTHPDCGVEWLKLRDRKGGDMAEWPEDLRVREYPSKDRLLEYLKAVR